MLTVASLPQRPPRLSPEEERRIERYDREVGNFNDALSRLYEAVDRYDEERAALDRLRDDHRREERA